jgi:hypothetical protein
MTLILPPLRWVSFFASAASSLNVFGGLLIPAFRKSVLL